jgi:hypothetical protein
MPLLLFTTALALALGVGVLDLYGGGVRVRWSDANNASSKQGGRPGRRTHCTLHT